MAGINSICWGEFGCMSHLRTRSSVLAGHLFTSCCSSEEDRQRIAATGQLVPSGSLRYKTVRAKLAWVKHLPAQRFFTEKCVQQALDELVASHDLALPSIPGFCPESWVRQQTKSVTRILQRARKSTVPMADPSLAETQVWDCQDRWVCVFCYLYPYQPPNSQLAG